MKFARTSLELTGWRDMLIIVLGHVKRYLHAGFKYSEWGPEESSMQKDRKEDALDYCKASTLG